MVDFSKITSMSFDNVERPKPAPQGHWLGMIESHEYGESSQKKTPFVRLNIKLVQPQDDVEQEAIEEAGGMEKITKRTLRHEFYLTEDAAFRLKEFFEEVLQMDTSGQTIADLVPQVNNQQVVVEVGHRIGGQNNDETFAEVKSLLPVE